jgi:hypothetical protein
LDEPRTKSGIIKCLRSYALHFDFEKWRHENPNEPPPCFVAVDGNELSPENWALAFHWNESDWVRFISLVWTYTYYELDDNHQPILSSLPSPDRPSPHKPQTPQN